MRNRKRKRVLREQKKKKTFREQHAAAILHYTHT